MILVGQYDSPFVRRVAITLHIYGIGFQRNTMSVFTDAAAMAKINPLGRVPSLILDDGEVLLDSAAIIDHLDESVSAERALTPRGGIERRNVLQIIAAASGAIEKAGALVYERYFHPPEAVSADWLMRCRSQLDATLVHLEGRCGDGWLAGNRVTQADITTAAMLGYLKLRVPEVGLEQKFPRLFRVSEVCEALPAFFRTRPNADEIMPAR